MIHTGLHSFKLFISCWWLSDCFEQSLSSSFIFCSQIQLLLCPHSTIGYMPDPFVTSLLGGEDPDNVTLERSSISTPGSTYFYIEEPIEIVLNLEEIETSTLPSNSDNIFNTITPTYLPLQPGYYSLTDIDGQNNEVATSSVREEGDVFIKVTIRFESRQQKELYIAAFDLITVPPHESDEEDIHAIRMKKDEVSIVYDLKRYGRVRDVTVIAV